jgi:small multidrug resistance pump
LIPDSTPSPNQAWVLLSVAIALKVAGTVCLRLSEGLTRWLPSLLIVAFYVLSFGINSFCSAHAGAERGLCRLVPTWAMLH